MWFSDACEGLEGFEGRKMVSRRVVERRELETCERESKPVDWIRKGRSK